MYTLILLSGGRGTRMNNSVPKQYMLLSGKPVIMHSLERIVRVSDIAEIIIVCQNEDTERIRCMIEQYAISANIRFAEAGETRQKSVLSGLQAASFDNVIIHEAARPFVKEEDFTDLINAEYDNVTYGISIPFTVLEADLYVEKRLDRSKLINVQLPQKYNKNQLLDAHSKARSVNVEFTEDAGLMLEYGYSVNVLYGKEYNIKMTTPMDMLVGEVIYKEYFSRRK